MFTTQWLHHPQGEQVFRSRKAAEREHKRMVRAGYSCGPVSLRRRKGIRGEA